MVTFYRQYSLDTYTRNTLYYLRLPSSARGCYTFCSLQSSLSFLMATSFPIQAAVTVDEAPLSTM